MDLEREPEPDRGKELVQRYEELRAEALGARDRSSRGLGWALFVRKGMAAWLEAWQEQATESRTQNAVSSTSLPEASRERQCEIVMVWTAMVMGQIPRAIRCVF